MTTSASPWELSVSKIADESPEREQIVRAPFHAEPEAVLALLRDEKCGPEGASLFEDVSELMKQDAYKTSSCCHSSSCVGALHPMDFRTIEEKMKRGEYEGEKSVLFWSDLSLIVVNVFM